MIPTSSDEVGAVEQGTKLPTNLQKNKGCFHYSPENLQRSKRAFLGKAFLPSCLMIKGSNKSQESFVVAIVL